MRIRFLTLAAVLALSAHAAMAQVRIGLMVSATGPTSAIGIPQKNTGELLPKMVGGVTIEYFQLEDGGDTTRAVQNAKKLIGEDNVDAIIGPSTTPNALAILDVIAEAKVPLLATVGTSSVVDPIDAKRRWVFKTTQNDDLIAGALINNMNKNGVKTRRFHRLQRPLRRKLVQGLRRSRRKSRHLDRRERALRSHRPERDGTGAEADRGQTRCRAHRRGGRPGGAAAGDALRPGLQRDESIRRTPSRQTTSSSLARKRSKARFSPPARCW